MPKILLTAFDAFGPNSVNPSEALLNSIEDANLVKLVLPTIYGKAENLLIDTVKKEKPQAIVLLGYSKIADPIKLELFAHNRDSEIAKGNLGQIGKRTIIPDAPAKLESTLPINDILVAWEKHDIRFKVSKNAGGFLCNHVSYVMLHWLKDKGLESVLCGFIHIGKGNDALEESQKAITQLLGLLEADRKIVAAHK